MRRAILVICCLAALAACGDPREPIGTPIPRAATPSTGCSSEEGQPVAAILAQYAREWADVNALASSTSRMVAAAHLSQLQGIRQELQSRQFHPCGRRAQELLVAMMDASIDGHVAFLRQEPDDVIAAHVAHSRGALDAFTVALAELGVLPGAATPAAVPGH